MNFAFTEEQNEIRAAAKRMMLETSTPERMRALAETERGWDPDDWAKIAELGWPGMHIPDEFGGAGLGYVELVVLLEEMGSVLYCSPFFATVCLAANALLSAPNPGDQAALLRAIADGSKTATLALTEPDGGWDAASVALAAKRDGDEFVLNGAKRFVINGHTADVVLVVARTGGAGENGVSLVAVEGDAAGLTRTLIHAFDETRKQAELTFKDVRVPASALVGAEGEGWPIVERTLQLASIALSAEMLGGAQKCMDVALEYTADRSQFGRPIGSFQAIKHRCADMLVALEQARSAAYYAGWVAANSEDELPVIASLAKAHVADGYWQLARDNIQIHGGIGFTWEHDAHLYYRRAKSSQLLFGDSDYHREQLIQRV